MELLVKILKHLFELRVEIINLLLLFIIAFSLGVFLKHRVLKFLSSFFFSLFISLQLVSLYFVDTFIGYQFYVHFNVRDVSEMLGIYGLQVFLLFLIIISLSIIFLYAHTISRYLIKVVSKRLPKIRIVRTKAFKTTSTILVVIGSLYFMNIDRGLIHSGIDLFSMLQVEERDISDVLNELGIDNYTYPENLEVEKGKNVIILSLESLEKGYLEGELSHLTPNLNRLKAEWNFYDMKPNSGSEWTSGSLYTNLSGLPAYFGVHGNNIFQKAYQTRISGISHVFEKADYSMTYITSSNAQFSGTEDLLHTFGIKKIIDQSQKGEQFRDRDLFEEAKRVIKNHQSNEESFALFLSTFDTHFPNGIYDDRMEKYITPKDNDLHFMIAAVDHMVGDFIQFLKTEKLLSNTIVYIFPDHLKMGSSMSFENENERSLYVITNGKEEDLKSHQNLYQLDLPDMILDGAQIQHNAKFFSNYIDQTNKDQFIKDHVQEITSLNNAGILRLRSDEYKRLVISKNYELYKRDTSRFIAHAGGAIDGFTYTNSFEALNKSYENGLRFFELDIIETSDGKFVAAHDWEYWQGITQFEGNLPPSETDFLVRSIRGKYTPMNMDSINLWFQKHTDAILVTDKVNQPKKFSEQFIDKKRLIMELFSWESVEEAVDSNIKPIVSENVIDELGSSAVQKLKEKKIDLVAVSKAYSEQNSKQMESFKKEGIKVYLYNLFNGTNLGEDYIIRYELDPVFGIYSDNWSFKSN